MAKPRIIKFPVKPNQRVITLVRLNEELSAIIRASAKLNFRSLAQEIQFRLQRDKDANNG